MSQKWLINFLLSIVAVFAPIKAALICVIVLTLVDMVTGILAARKRGEKVTSAGLSRTVVKLFVYELAAICGFLTETYMTGTWMPICKMVTTLIGITELKSILENLDTIVGGSFFAALIRKLASKNAFPENSDDSNAS